MLAVVHFIRPWWLLAIPVGLLIAAMVWQLRDVRTAWRGVIAPGLLDALLVRAERRRRLVPVHLLGAAAVLAPLALAGPSWRREPSPFVEETAALIVVLEVSRTMNTEDVPPTRLERSAQKIADLFSARPDTDAALVAYAGSAHLAMPITTDTSIVAQFAAALAPDVMPADGNATASAIVLANEQLRRAGRSGSILLVTDGVPEDETATIAGLGSVPVHVLAMTAGAPPVSLDRIASATDGSVTRVSADERDIERLATRVQRDIGRAAAPGDGQQWRDAGYWLVAPLAVITLAWSRRGWAIRYGIDRGSVA